MATTDLTGRRVLAIVTNYGVEQDELVVPARALREAGATVVVAAQSTEPIQTLVGDKDPGETVRQALDLDEDVPLGPAADAGQHRDVQSPAQPPHQPSGERFRPDPRHTLRLIDDPLPGLRPGARAGDPGLALARGRARALLRASGLRDGAVLGGPVDRGAAGRAPRRGPPTPTRRAARTRSPRG